MWACAAVLLFLQTLDYTAEGTKALEAAKYDQAAELFGKAVAVDPKDYSAHFNLALSYTMLKRDSEGIAEYKKVLELKPGLYEAELNAGILLIRDMQPADALRYLQPAVEQKPKEFRPRLYWAQALLDSGDAAKAAEQYRAALDLDRKSTRLNSSHLGISYAVFCLKKKCTGDAAEFQRDLAGLHAQGGGRSLLRASSSCFFF